MNKTLVISITGLLAGSLGYYLGMHHTGQPVSTPSRSSVAQHVLYWYDPMTPDKHFDHPGKSPFMPSMNMVPKYANETGATNSTVISINPRIEQNLGLRSAVVRVAALAPELRVTGVLDWDRRRSVAVSARTDGVLTHLFIRAPFDRVRAGQALGTLQAPSWSAAVAELRVLSNSQSTDEQALRSDALERLHVLGMSDAEISQLGTNPAGGIVLRAPVSGVVSALEAISGQSVNAGTLLMRIDDLAHLWLNAAIPQAEVTGIHAGTPVHVEIDALPGRIFNSTVEALLPEVDPRTRTQTARIALDNSDGSLAPGMYATIRLYPAGNAPHPLVPDEALISTGLQNRVILDLGNGHVEPRVVRTGHSANGYTEILAGLSGGENVVTSSQFLIDSEADLDGTLQRLTPAAVTMPAVATVVMKPMHKLLYWYDPMVPNQHFTHGGPSPLMPIMNLVAKYADQASGAQP